MKLLSYNREQIQKVELTPEELEAAIWEGKIKKYFKEKHKHYWDEQEKEHRKTGRDTTKTEPG